jgi:2,3-bisphosphoglycerate-independent phosphoglycerate mutase
MTSSSKKSKEKVLLIVLDGWGLYRPFTGNAIERAKTPFYDKLWNECPTAVLEASAETVGLPQGQMGTSEVNHFTIGAGRVVFQDLVRINQAIDDGSFYERPAFVQAAEYVKEHNSTLHLIGVASTGGVHAHQQHLIELLRFAKKQSVQNVVLHIITDGRDTPPKSGLTSVAEIEQAIKSIGVGRIASVIGRYYAMDRDHNWDRTNKAFDLMTKGQGKQFSSAVKAIEVSYQNGITDEFIEPAVIGSEGTIAKVEENDAVIFANFRSDRPRQLTEAFLERGPKSLHFVTMTRYNPNYDVNVAFEPQPIPVSIGQVLSEAGVKQLRVTETEKFAHMTFFINCKREEPFEGEDRLMFDSYSDIKTHDERPQMRAMDIAQAIVSDMKVQAHQVIFTNLCNADMVGHSGKIEPTIVACETIDKALKLIIPVAQEEGYHVIITADHGNADMLEDPETHSVITSHTLNPVPFILYSNKYTKLKRNFGSLIDVAPTILTMLHLPIPASMTGESFV